MDKFKHENNLIVQNTNVNIQNYITQVYSWMMVGLLLTAFASWYTINNSNIVEYLKVSNIALMSLIIIQILLVISLVFLLPKLSDMLVTTMFMFYSCLTGLTTSAILAVYTNTSITSTFFITAIVFGALSLYGYITKNNLNNITSFLFMVLTGVIFASSVNIWLKNSFIELYITYISIILFSFLTAYDIQKIKNIGNKMINHDNNKNLIHKYAIIGALTLYLDFINIFLIILRITDDRR